jgi:hypothetical protein
MTRRGLIKHFVTQTPYRCSEDQCDGCYFGQEIRLGAHSHCARKRCRLEREAQGDAAGIRGKADRREQRLHQRLVDQDRRHGIHHRTDRAREGKAKSAKNAEIAKLATDVDSHKADIQDSLFSGSTSGQLDSGTKIDLNAGTITLSDGTVIDLKTGAKKINIVA